MQPDEGESPYEASLDTSAQRCLSSPSFRLLLVAVGQPAGGDDGTGTLSPVTIVDEESRCVAEPASAARARVGKLNRC